MEVTRFIVNNFEENTYLVVDDATKECAVIDPGMLHKSEESSFEKYILENNLKLTQIILTHGHLDHCFGANFVKSRYGVPVKAHEGDLLFARTLEKQCERFGMLGTGMKNFEFDVLLKDGDVINIGESQLKVIGTPGHSQGSVILYDAADKIAFVGDVIFSGSIGRTDLPGGDFKTIIDSIRNNILTLPDDTLLLPGHGDPTTVEKERLNNPYLK